MENKLNRENIEEIYPLSPMQEGMYFHGQLQAESQAYFEQVSYRYQGSLEPALLEQSLQQLIGRHSVLRTVFSGKKADCPLQVVLKQGYCDFQQQDLRGKTPLEQQQYVQAYKQADKARGFDLGRQVLLRVRLFALGEESYAFLWSFPHLLLDGWSTGVLVGELFALYQGLLTGAAPQLPPARAYKHYIEWLGKQDQARALGYWRQYLEGYEQAAGIAKDKPQAEGYANGQLLLRLGEQATKRLEQLASRRQVSLNVVLQSSWGVLLGKYNGVGDVVFGAVVSGRPSAIGGIESMVGLFINTLPVRVIFEPETAFGALLEGVQRGALEGQAYDYLPLAQVQSLSRLGSGLLDHLLIVENYPLSEGGLSHGGHISRVEVFEQTNYDLNVVVGPGRELTFKFEYNANVYRSEFIEALAGQWLHLLEQVARDESVRIGDLELLPPSQQQVLAGFNDTGRPYPQASIGTLFAEQARLHAHRAALVWEDGEMSYGELEAKANQVAHYLLAHYELGHDPLKGEALVGLLAERGPWQVIGLLGILKAGAAYLPLDGSYPKGRLEYLLTDAAPKVLLTDGPLPGGEWGEGLPVVDLAGQWEGISRYPTGSPGREVTAAHLAYVMYTSGSTGKPKGVMVEHGNVVRLVRDTNYTDIRPHDRLLQLSNYVFDGATFDIFGALLNGAALYLVNPEGLLSNDYLAGFIRRHGINVTFITTALFNSLTDTHPDWAAPLDKVYFGGENASLRHIRRALAATRPGALVHVYGPTEATTFSTYHVIHDLPAESLSVPIGKPIANCRVHILDDNRKPVPVGASGEIYLAGDGIARGYLNRPELTAEKFLVEPGAGGGRLYRTGDLGKWLPDGSVEFLGRLDNQVKIRGYRIELGEIENTLLKHAAVREAVVVARGDAEGSTQLVAYYRAEAPVDAAALRGCLRASLPDYMIPGHFIQLDRLPLNGNGKVARNLLPPPGAGPAGADVPLPPAGTIETRLVAIWEEVLDRPGIGVRDHFFEIGGHSLKATRVASRVSKELGVKLEIKTIFAHPVLADLAACIAASAQTRFQAIEPVAKGAHYAVSHAQKRLWILDQFAEDQVAYNIPQATVFEGSLHRQALEQALDALLARHESLRTTFITVDGEPRQKVHAPGALPFALACLDLRPEADREARVRQLARQEASRPFDLGQGPLVRATLLRTADDRHVFLFTLHHIIADGWSLEVLTRELIGLYNACRKQEPGPLRPLRIQYKDYAAWQQAQLSGERLQAHRDYWRSRLGGEIPVLALPTDYPRPAAKTYAGDNLGFEIDAGLHQALGALSRKYNASLFIVLLASVKALLYRYCGQEDLVIGSPVAGRTHADLEDQVGFYVNTLALRTQFSGREGFAALLGKVRETTLSAYEHQFYPFDRLVDDLDLARDMSRSPLFDVFVTCQNFGAPVKDGLDGLAIHNYPGELTISKFDLSFYFRESESGLSLVIEYNTGLFARETVVDFYAHYRELLASIAQSEHTPLGHLEIIPAEGRHQLLHAFNHTAAAYPDHATIHGLFEAQVRQTPDAVALTYESRTLTYGELNAKANQLAACIGAHQPVRPDDPVGLLVDRSEWMVIGMLGILKAGAAYVPIDPAFPQERIAGLIEDTGLQLLLTQARYLDRCDALQWETEHLRTYLCLEGSCDPDFGTAEQESRTLWDYTAAEHDDDYAASGWINSYTGRVFADRDMEELVANVTAKLRPHLHAGLTVLEVGCGSGVLMAELAPLVKTYYATDLSAEVLKRCRRKVETRGLSNVSLHCLTATEIDRLEGVRFDVIIVNSVVQYFPSYHYCRQFLHQAASRLAAGGILFLGDVRDQALQGQYYHSLTGGDDPRNEKIAGRRRGETELFLRREFLSDYFARHFPGARVEFSAKTGTVANELTLYRYDALIRPGAGAAGTPQKVGITDLRLDAYPAEDRDAGAGSANLAYILFTSGSTGRPKGVQVTHRSVVNFLASMQQEPGIGRGDKLLALTTYTFDISVLELFLPLVSGAAILLLGKESRHDPHLIGEIIAREKPTLMQATPATWNMLLDGGWGGDRNLTVLCGGERLGKELAVRLLDAAKAVWNLYGPTETTVWSTIKRLTPGEDRISIGKPIGNTQAYLLDERQRLAPRGAAGEIYLGGAGLARGYHNRPDLTAERFVANPFEPGAKLYRTGDLGRWGADGNLEYLGRRDDQLKVNGHRVEPGEIESHLLAADGVQSAVVAAVREEDGSACLAAYLVAPAVLEPAALRNHLLQSLPAYLVPAYFVQLEALPLTPSGKVDKKALPDPTGQRLAAATPYEAPAGELETKLLAVWRRVLGRAEIGVNDNFFESGGHSLKATRVVALIYQELGLRVELRKLFNHPTVRALAAAMQAADPCPSLYVQLNRTHGHCENAFLIPPGLGTPIVYKGLARELEGVFNCYGLQCKGLEHQDTDYDESIAQMADTFLQEILRIQASGTFLLIGYSLGATVAFEVAKQLERRHHKTRLLLLDMVGVYDASTVPEVSDAQADALMEREIGEWLAAIGDPQLVARIKTVAARNRSFVNTYRISGSVQGDITAIEARDNLPRIDMTPWRDRTTGAFRHCLTDGNHFQVLAEANLPRVAGILKESLGLVGA